MSLLRRKLLMTPQNETFYTKFTVKFEEGSENNALYISEIKHYGIAFRTRISVIQLLGGYNKIKYAVKETVTIRNQFGEPVYSYEYIHPKLSYNYEVSHVVYNTGTATNVKNGLYTVEVSFKAQGKIALTEDSSFMTPRDDVVYIMDYTSQATSGKNATTHNTKCLYSIEEENPKGSNDLTIGSASAPHKGIINSMSYFVEGE